MKDQLFRREERGEEGRERERERDLPQIARQGRALARSENRSHHLRGRKEQVSDRLLCQGPGTAPGAAAREAALVGPQASPRSRLVPASRARRGISPPISAQRPRGSHSSPEQRLLGLLLRMVPSGEDSENITKNTAVFLRLRLRREAHS